MREIKFRAWDNFNGEYVYSEHMNAPTNKRRLSTFFENCAYAEEGENRIIIEQYTGLYDKNGVEIYEGDILLKSQPKKRSVYIVHFQPPSFTIELNDSKPPKCRFMKSSDGPRSEIIGNIHENQELLEKAE